MCPEPAALDYLLFFKRKRRNKGVRSSYSGMLVLAVKKGEELLRTVAASSKPDAYHPRGTLSRHFIFVRNEEQFPLWREHHSGIAGHYVFR
jgi:hypothetical protein